MPPSNSLDRRLVAAVERLGRALRVARQQLATRHGMTILQLQILEVLGNENRRNVGQIAAELDVTQPTISDALTSLESKGLVERSRSTDDARVTLLALTVPGATLAKEVAVELAPLIDTTRTSSEGDRATALTVILEEILRLQQLGIISVNRSCLSCRHYQQPALGHPGHCLLLDQPLHPPDLRVDCPDHLQPA